MDNFIPYKLNNIDEPFLLPQLEEINESSYSREKCLEALRIELKNLQDIEPCLEESFLLRFLRVSKFDTSNALQRILKYYQHHETLFDALKKLSLSVEKARSLKHAWVSPYRLKNNSFILFALGGKVDYSKFSFPERLYLDILAVNSTFENPVNQITGVTTVFDYKGFNIRSFLAHTPGWTRIFVEAFLKGCPSRIKAIHVVNAPSSFLAAFKVISAFLPRKIQERVFMHPNDGWKTLHSVIPPEVLPEEYGGKLKFDSCINVLENIEESNEQFLKMFQYGFIKTKAGRQLFRPICR